MTIDEFAAELERRIGRPSFSRPFVCDGSPLTCSAFVVGFNAATQLTADFWKFWVPGYGFDKALWFVAYSTERKLAGRGVSPTRQRIERIAGAAGAVRCLETNVYSAPTASARRLSSAHRDASVFRFLVETIRPVAMLIHGRETAIAIQEVLRTGPLPVDAFRPMPTPWGTSQLRAVRHLSRGWSFAQADELGRELASAAAERHRARG
jgi:hypothetical protein